MNRNPMAPATTIDPYCLKVVPRFESEGGDLWAKEHYRRLLFHHLRKILPEEIYQIKENDHATWQHQQAVLKRTVPLIACLESGSVPGKMSFISLSRVRQKAFTFFYDMLSSWLTPGCRLTVDMVYSSDFQLAPELCDQIYTLCEIVIDVEDGPVYEEIKKNFPIIRTEIALGIHSEYHAQRILEIKGLSVDDKAALVQGSMAHLIKRFPKAYERDIMTEMQHVLVTCRDEFKAARKVRHLSRIIGIQYLFRHAISESMMKNAARRYLNLKIFKSHIKIPGGASKDVLCLLVGFNFLKDQETFGQLNFLKAIQQYLPSVEVVEHSFLMPKLGCDKVCVAYLEVVKRDGTSFTTAEIRKLRKELPTNLKNRIEQKLHPVFMPRNEEEIMRNMVVLANQIRYLRDIPQIFVSFDEQAHTHLSFTVILARVLKQDLPPICTLFKQAGSFAEYIHDRTKIMGYMRKKYPKETTVFHLRLPKESFLRADHSIDLHKARQAVVGEVSRVVGEVRDYNGGMISKQHELLSDIRELLIEEEYDDMLLDNFFYSLAPVVIRALIDPITFKTLFLMVLEGLRNFKQETFYSKFHTDHHNCFAVVISEDYHVRDAVDQALQVLHFPKTELVYAHVKAYGNIFLGYICCSQDPLRREAFFQAMERALA